MKITEKEAARMAALSRLKPDKKEEKILAKELSSVLAYIEKLKKADTAKTEPLSQITRAKNRSRADEPAPFQSNEAIIRQAPAKSLGFVETNKIFE